MEKALIATCGRYASATRVLGRQLFPFCRVHCPYMRSFVKYLTALSLYLCLTGMAGGALDADDAAVDGLIKNSPFLPPNWKQSQQTPAPPEPPAAPRRDLTGELEFRGVFSMGGDTSFSIYDKTAQTSRWLRSADSTDKFTVERYHPSRQTLAIKVDGQIQELKLSTADDVPMPIAGMPGATGSDAGRPPSGPGSSPPTTRPPPPPGAGERPTVPRRRIIRPDGSSDAANDNPTPSGRGGTTAATSRSRGQPAGDPRATGSSGQPFGGDDGVGSAPDFVPPPPPNFVPPPPPQ